ncbi:autotransporter outer membrane beta-barrel domain-containing protein [Steroidobacter gossypii]|nr:autotransporter outer membrane beta-barrel domain-containing protein [Steroidobacter gossypii]
MRPLRLGVLIALGTFNAPARAADLYWDVNGSTVGLGGTGVWDLSSLFWGTNSDGTTLPYSAWNNPALDNAFFSGTAGTVTLGVPITAHNLRFQVSSYSVTGGTLTLAGAAPTIYMAHNTTLSSTLAGTSGVTFNGQGSTSNYLWLAGTNTITGGITLTNGAYLVVTGSNALNGANNIVTVNPGTILRIDHNNAFGGDTAASRLLLSGGQLRLLAGRTLAHDLTLTGGTSTIYEEGSGIGTWNGTAVLTASSTLNLGAESTLRVTGNLSDTGANVLSLNGFGGARLSGDLSFSGNFTLSGGATWFDGGTHTYTGETILTGGQLVLNSATTRSQFTNFRFDGTTANLPLIYGTAAVPNITLPLGSADGQISWSGTGGFWALGAGQAGGGSDVTVNLGGASAPLTWGVGGFVPDGQWLILGTNEASSNARQIDFQNPIDLNGAVRTVRVDNGNITDHALLSGQLTGTGGLLITSDGALEMTHTGNNYSGATIVGNGVSGSFGNLILSAPGSLSPNSNLQINGAGSGNLVQHGGYVLLNDTSGSFTRAVGTGAGQVQWTASGGFGAIGAPQTVDLGGAGATLTWGSGGFVPTGHALRFGGNWANSTINWQNGIDLGAADRVINANEGQGAGHVSTSDLEVNLNGVIQGTGGLILNGAGDVALNALNTYEGTTWIGGTSVSGDGDTKWVWANTLANTGTASSLGAGSTVVFGSHAGGLIYTGGTTSTNRTLALHRTNSALHYLFNRGSGALTWSGNITTTGSGLNTLRLGGTYTTSDADGDGIADAPNVISGIISNGTGVTEIQGSTGGNCSAGGSVWRLTGANTFTGNVNPLGCVIEVTTIGNAGAASAVGAGTLIADFVGGNGTLRYIGAGDTSDRSFWAWGDSRLESSGAGALNLTNTAIVVSQNAGFTFTLGGTNTGDNRLAATLVDGPTPAEFASSWFRLVKQGPGLWALVTDNNARANAYSGMTRIFGGALRLDNAGAITGGLGVTSSHGATGSSQRSSVIRFEGAADGSGGVLGLTAASGGFFRGLTTIGGEALQSNNGTTVGADPDGAGPLPAYGIEALDDDIYVHGVRWVGSGGFAAWDGTQTVDLFGDAREVTWGTGGFVPAGHHLMFGYVTADGTVDFRNGINLGAAVRNVLVNDGLAERDAIMSGVLRSTSAAGGLTKLGAGTLTLTANNTYTGSTTISAGTLEVGNGGTTGTLGNGAQADVAGGATLVANRSNAYTLTQNVNGDGTLVQRGSGTTTMTGNSNIDHVVIEHGRLVTPGSLSVDDITFSNDGGAALQVSGTLQTAAAGATLLTGGTGADTVQINTGASLRANGSLGDGNDTLDVAGTLDTGAGTLDLGIGNDTFVVHDSTNVIGTVIGGAGVDTLNTDIATTANLQVVQTFETLTKTGIGTLNVNGPGTSDFSTINVNAGTLNVAVGADISAAPAGTLAATVATGATLNVNGAFGCGTGSDSLTIAGNVTGNGTIDQCGGDDLLRLRDGANLSGYAGVLDGGAHTVGVGDTVELDITTSLDFAQGTVSNYENLLKSNVGIATLSGAHGYDSTTISGGTLNVNGSLTTPTIAFTNVTGTTALTIEGTVQASGPTQTLISGSTGNNSVTVAAGGTLLATGDLGAGDDTLDLAGTLNTGGGVFMLADGDDQFVIHDGTNLIGTVDGGTGFDSLNANIAGVAEFGAVSTFEQLIKSGVGTLNINGPAPSDFVSVDVQAGTLNIAPAGSLNGMQSAAVASGATLVVDGSLTFTSGADLFTVAGEVSGLSTIDMLDGADTLTIRDGADLSGLATSISGGTGTDTLTADIAGSANLGGAIDFETLIKTNVGTFNILGPAASQFDTVLVQGGTLHVGAGAVVDPQTTVVDAGATMTVDGTYTGTIDDDTFTVSGTVNGIGTIDLLAGDDVLTINDGGDISGLTHPIDGGAHTPAGDSVVLNFTSGGTLAGGDVINFENLVKQGAGTATLTAAHAYSGGSAVQGGALTVSGVLQTPTVSLADNTALNVNGSVEASGGSMTTINGSAGANAIAVGVDGTLLATGDLGDGVDTLDVFGTLDAGAGTFLLGDGNDNFIVHDATVVIGTVDGGAGFDTRTYDIDTTANVGALVNFEGVTKAGTGVLNIMGPAATSLGAVDVLGGTLNIAAAGSVVALLGGTLDTLVGAGATLHVDGSYGCGNGNDTMRVSGTVSGSGVVDLCGGEDTLTLSDGAVLATTISGGAHGSGDTVALDISSTYNFDDSATIDFENLVKQNIGNATLIGTQNWSQVDIAGGTLTVSDVLETPVVTLADDTTLTVSGTLHASGAGYAIISGSAGVNTVTVSAGATLRASGDLGDGADMLDVAGSLDTNGGVFSLGAGDDTFMVHDGTAVLGTVDGGLGNDLLNVEVGAGNTVPLASMLGFESLGKSGLGTLQITGPSTFIDVDVTAGLLQVSAGGSVAAQNTTVAAGSILQVTGSYTGTAGNDTMVVAGTVTGGGTIDLADGSDTFTIQQGADLSGLSAPVNGGAGIDAFIADIAGDATLGGAINFETLTKTNSGTLHVDGPASSAFSIVNVNGGTLDIGLAGSMSGVATTTIDSGATLHVDGSYGGSSGNDTFVLSGTLAGAGPIDLGDGDDVLTINTGATIGFTGVFDAGAATADRFVLSGTGSDDLDASLLGTAFQNFDGFHKEGVGTWRLTGTSDRDWTVSEGTLIGDSASFGGDIANAATVIFDQTVDGTYGGVVSGSGTLIKQSAGTLIVSGIHTFTGSTQVAAGTLQVDGTLPGTTTVASGAILSGIGSVANVMTVPGGFVAPGNAATPFGTLTLAGDYAGTGTIRIDTQLDDANSATSRLVVRGSTSGANSTVLINRIGGDGAQTAGDGIAIIEVGGASPADSFRLARPVQAGAYEYLLYQGGVSDANDWFLRSQLTDPQLPDEEPLPAYRPSVAGYVLGPQANLEYGFTALGNLRARVGDQGRVTEAKRERATDDVWMRVHADEIDAVGSRFQALDLSIQTLQFGTDIYTYEVGQTAAHVGVMASVGESRATFFDAARSIAGLTTRAGIVETDAQGAGVYWTGYGKRGGYFDVAMQLLYNRNRYRDAYLGTGNQSGWSGTVSAEIGAPFPLGATHWRMEPQLQLAYQRLELDDFRDEVATISEVKDDGLRARAGVQVFRVPTSWFGMNEASPYVGLGAQRDFADAPSATIGSTTIREELPDTTADVSVGFTGSIQPGVALHLDVRYQQSTEGEKDGVRANFGFRMSF